MTTHVGQRVGEYLQEQIWELVSMWVHFEIGAPCLDDTASPGQFQTLEGNLENFKKGVSCYKTPKQDLIWMDLGHLP